MKSYNLKTQNTIETTTTLSTKEKLLRTIDEKYIDALERAIAAEDERLIHRIMNNFSLEIYKVTGVWYDEFDYYGEYGDNLNGYVSLLIHRLNETLK